MTKSETEGDQHLSSKSQTIEDARIETISRLDSSPYNFIMESHGDVATVNRHTFYV